MINARKILKRFKPDVVIGVGGFASGPTMKTAASMGIPIVIQEQNSYPGITNKIVAKKAAKICVAYDNMEKWFPKDKIVLTGNPLRNNIVPMNDRRGEVLRFLDLIQKKRRFFWWEAVRELLVSTREYRLNLLRLKKMIIS
jgi:UDP-N-acetylglucosamine--N-acetylmuramyl-(pentapeptide) pyrophosphoryl-undecaprenol N-acetylglucosamine transferase